MTDNLPRNKYDEEGLVHYNDIVEPGVYIPVRFENDSYKPARWRVYKLLALHATSIRSYKPTKIWINSDVAVPGVTNDLMATAEGEETSNEHARYTTILYRKAEHLEGAVIFKLKE